VAYFFARELFNREHVPIGIINRGAGLRRAKGGMRGFWLKLVKRYKEMGGVLLVGQKVEKFERAELGYLLTTRKGTFRATQVVSAILAENTMIIAPPNVKHLLERYVMKDKHNYESAIVLFLGVRESEIICQDLTHHQLFYDYDLPLGNGNNMFISVSAARDTESAPEGFRSVMISTHCKLSEWRNLTESSYKQKRISWCPSAVTDQAHLS
jgi:phytoene dehydrogenase-like protein